GNDLQSIRLEAAFRRADVQIIAGAQAKVIRRVNHVTMIRRYESDEVQPTLEIIRKLSCALSVSADTLVFDKAERNPDDELRLQFEAVSQFSPEEKEVARVLLESLILKHDANRFTRNSQS
ncbi:helix-turn-helix domain-containing protein, partial [Lonsdalea quercina]|uniref:helix-turn-helix domain-containing protein n=1 Tax=Lonsdalea quercina TaxID=71657 RepID=UPI003974B4E6